MFFDSAQRPGLSSPPTTTMVSAPPPGRAAVQLRLVGAGAAAALFVLLAVAVTAGGGPGAIDQAVLHLAVTGRTPAWTELAWLFTRLGSGPVLAAVAVAAAIAIWFRARRLLPAVAVPLTLAATAALVTVLKIVLARPRPPASLMLGPPAASQAFPSGHTTNGTVVYMLVAVLLAATVAAPWARRTLLAAGVAVAVLIGWSRVYLGYHWMSDVVAGWLLASAIITTVATLLWARTAPRPAPDRPPAGQSTAGVVENRQHEPQPNGPVPGPVADTARRPGSLT